MGVDGRLDPAILVRVRYDVGFARVAPLVSSADSATPAAWSAAPGRGHQHCLKVHFERASVVLNRRPDGVEQTVSKVRLQGGVFAG